MQEPIVLENINQNQPIYQGGITVLKMTILLIMSFMQIRCQDKLLTLLNSESKLILYNNKTYHNNSPQMILNIKSFGAFIKPTFMIILNIKVGLILIISYLFYSKHL